MGGGSSKVSAYSLHCIDDAGVDLHVSRKQGGWSSSSKSPTLTKANSQLNSPALAASSSSSSSSSSSGSGSGSERVKSPETNAGTSSSSKSHKSDKSDSHHRENRDQREESPPGSLHLTISQRQQSQRKSIAAMSLPAPMTSSLSIRSSKGTGMGIGLQASLSDKFPWILKSVTPSVARLDSLDVERVIGTGYMGTVRLAKLKDKPGYLALKGVRKEFIAKHRDHRHIENERAILLLMTSPFCVRLFGTFQEGPNVYFALELAAGGELFRRLNKKSCFPEQEAKFYLTEIFSALDHIHDIGFCYRDLKPENVMLDEEGHCKLVDFGFATRPDESGILKTLCGTPAYLSPEQLNGKFTNGYSKACDWWSLGILLYELMTGKTPFCKSNKESNYEVYLRILKVKISFPRAFGKESRELVQSLCHANLDKRLVDQHLIKAHAYFAAPWDKVAKRMLVPPFVPRLTADSADRDHYFRKYPSNAGGSSSGSGKDEWSDGRLDLEGF